MFDWLRQRRDQRALSRVPAVAWLAFIAALLVQLSFAMLTPRAAPSAADLKAPPSVAMITVASLGDPLPAAKIMNLLLQAHDNQPGLSIPFASLDYPMVVRWLERIIDLDPRGPYPLLAASRLYGEVPDAARQRLMLDFVHRQFLGDPNRRWAALAHAAYVARHRLLDLDLAREYARSLRLYATSTAVPAWAKQMEILLLADMNELATARVLLGALLESGQVTDAAEFRFLSSRLGEISQGKP